MEELIMNTIDKFKKAVFNEKTSKKIVNKDEYDKSKSDKKNNEESLQQEFQSGDKIILSLFEGVFSRVTQTHFWHLETKDESVHRTLGEFYETLTKKADDFLEQLMGDFGKCDSGYKLNVGSPIPSCNGICEYMDEFINDLKSYKSEFPEEYSHHKNTIEEIISFVSHIKYKLKLI